ncbi:four helix bundle protein [Imperialibacter roseus]|uniref:Four helix bundle protein n=1 Tax=Imperialibacter roseus TaxID=1324217 RepID=A0ABZ0ITH1_9BACT|nr:four helix bundle protein [Imperialibacter roseus]WOK08327.1 four helix bundle protein [Imperialibacter roseus]|tara:strand:+ start:31573 stop:31986 length:414 start_codon:yes stop_codon:yes gene_type:complete
MEKGNRYVRSFRDLDVYKMASNLTNSIFEITKRFPKEEMYSLTDQVRRSSRSVGAQIAEAWGKRRYEKHFISKLTDADAEQLETQHWIEVALNCQYISVVERNALIEQCNYIGKMIYSMIAKSKMFCSGGTQSETDH